MLVEENSIPHEILHHIFRIATDVPDPLVCFEQDYHGSRRDTSGRSYNRYRESLVCHPSAVDYVFGLKKAHVIEFRLPR